MADAVSRALSCRASAAGAALAISDAELSRPFNECSPHSQANLWQLFHFSNKLSALTFSKLRWVAAPTLGSWLRVAAKGSGAGATGKCVPTHLLMQQALRSPARQASNAPTLSLASLDGPGREAAAEAAARPGAHQLKSRCVLLEQPSTGVR